MRFFVALEGGRVVGSRMTTRHYTHAVLHCGGANGTFATFHTSAAHAQAGTQHFVGTAPRKVIVPTVETPSRPPLWVNLGLWLEAQP